MRKPKTLKKFLVLGLSAVLATAAFAAKDLALRKTAPAEGTPQEVHVGKQGKPKALKMVPVLRPDRLGSGQRPATRPWTGDRKDNAPRRITSEESGKIYGGAIYADSWTNEYQPVGIYSFKSSDGSTVEPVKIGEDYVVTGGGFFANGQYHYVSYMSFMGFVLADLYTVDFETWEIVRDMPVQVGAVAQDMAYDPTTGFAYGCFMNDDGDAWIFGYLDIETGERTWLSDLDVVVLAVGVNSHGEVYGVALDGNFYRFDKKTGEMTLIGATGRKPVYSASGCFDLSDDTFYWECIEADAKANIYTIDLKTGAATYVTTLDDNLEMTGMFIPLADAEDEAPAAISDLTLSFPEGSLEGKITFTAPQNCFNSADALTGTLDWTVVVNDDDTFTGTATPGSAVEVSYKADEPGLMKVSAYTANSVGRSPVSSRQEWVGPDAPATVENLKVSQTVPGEVTVSWDVPSQSVNGGYISADGMRYDVVRMPEEIKVGDAIPETSLTEKFDLTADFRVHYYVVTPIFDGVKGLEKESDMFSTGSVALPYINRIDDETDFAGFTVEDSNEDGDTWTYDPIYQTARIKYNFTSTEDGFITNNMDDWMFTPAVRLEAGKMIRFALDSRNYGTGYNERFEVKLGKTPDSSAMTETVIARTNVTKPEWTTYEGYVSVEEDGLYYFGVHGCSIKDQLYLYVDNITVEDGPVLGTPGQVTDLTAKAASNGALEATVSFKAPSSTVEGTALESLDKIVVKREGTTIHTFTNPNPGESLQFTDTEAAQGDNTYSVSAFNSVGEGYSTSVKVYVGHDRPGVPVDVKAHEVDGKVVITWKAPVEGETGGYFDPSALTYTILRANDEKELATGVKDLTFTDVPPLDGQHHEFFVYYVYAQSPAGYGYGYASNSVCFGKSFNLPFKESFADGSLLTGPWDVNIPEESYGWWKIASDGTYPTAAPQDKDNGLVTFIPEEEGDSGELISGKVSLKGAQYPALDFWWYCTPGSTDKIYVYINPDDEGRKLATRVELGSGNGEGWTKTSVDLSQYTSAENIQVIFSAVSTGAYYNIHMDNIRIHDTYDNDLEVANLSVPARMMSGESYLVYVDVINDGINSISDYSIELYRDGKLMDSTTPGRLLKDASQTVSFTVTPDPTWGSSAKFHAQLNCAADQNEANDKTEEVEAVITDCNYPAVSDLTAERGDNMSVALEWSEPELVSGTGETNLEDVEGIKPFSIDNMGEWTVIDGDKAPTYGVGDAAGNMLMYENAGAPMAFMAFNPVQAGIPVEDYDGTPTAWAAHSGDQYFASFAANGTKNDDWLISPFLPGIQQEISFWVKSQTSEYGYEKYEVYYSKDGISKEDFVRIGDVRSAPIQWVQEKVTLPEGTRYFAIRCISDDCYVFMLDDIKFTTSSAYMGELSLIGYNVYRDLELLNETPIMEQSYLDREAGASAHVYNVTAVYDLGESRLSNDATVADVSSVGTVANGVKVESGQGWIQVTAEAGTEVTVFTTDGLKVAEYVSEGVKRFNVPSGIYVVVLDGRNAAKVAVR